MPDGSSSPPGDGAKGPPKRRPSPILIPGKKEPAHQGPVRKWLRDHLSSSTSEPGPKSKPAPDPVPAGTSQSTTGRAGRDPGTPQELEPQRATTQMLPGRLQPLDAGVIQQTVRFLRTPGEIPRFTLGWEFGDPHAHVTLDHPSIQPRHARMTYEDGSWVIESLDEHHPVMVNGEAVPAGADPVLLKNGDEVRIGEAVFGFLLP